MILYDFDFKVTMRITSFFKSIDVIHWSTDNIIIFQNAFENLCLCCTKSWFLDPLDLESIDIDEVWIESMCTKVERKK
jgi:hypothetical protein